MKLFKYNYEGHCGFSGNYYSGVEWFIADDNNKILYFKNDAWDEYVKYNCGLIGREYAFEQKVIYKPKWFPIFKTIENKGWNFVANLSEEIFFSDHRVPYEIIKEEKSRKINAVSFLEVL